MNYATSEFFVPSACASLPISHEEAKAPREPSAWMTRSRPLLLFFTLAFGVSWLSWAPLVLAQKGLIAWQPSKYLHLIGSLGHFTAIRTDASRNPDFCRPKPIRKVAVSTPSVRRAFFAPGGSLPGVFC